MDVGLQEQQEKDIRNIQNEILLVGSLFKDPDLYVSWGQYIRSKYDFDDEATRFFYDSFELMYKTFAQSIDENKVNTFMSQDKDRLKTYKTFGAYKLISQWIALADVDDFKNYFNIVKKYSLVREYERNGYPVQKILQHRKFNEMTASDIYKLIRAKADKISTIILANEESVILNENTEETIGKFLIKPQMGLELPYQSMNEMFRGCRLGKVVFNGFLSNEGKTRNLMKLMAYITLAKNEKFLLLSNEMDEEDLRSALITTVVNNKEFKELHGIDIIKPEREIVLGQYRDNFGKFIERETDSFGDFIESEEEYINRVNKNSSEYKKLLEIGKWIDSKRDKQIFFKDVGNDYSDQTLEFEYRKHNIVHGVKYGGYDTMKGYGTDDWQSVKQTATSLKELMKDIKMFLWAVFQLTDDTVFTDIFQLSSNNIANAKQMKHVVDILTIGKRIPKEDYHKYAYISYTDWGKPIPKQLEVDKTYYGMVIDKNRGGSKDRVPLFEVNLDFNTWYEIGYLIRK
jgi:replicative DNA helicase